MGEFQIQMRWVLMLVSVLIFAVAFLVILVAAWGHHRSKALDKGNFHNSIWVEISWAAAPLVIVFMLVWPSVRTLLAAL